MSNKEIIRIRQDGFLLFKYYLPILNIPLHQELSSFFLIDKAKLYCHLKINQDIQALIHLRPEYEII